jgi:signal transduction histidine kinase
MLRVLKIIGIILTLILLHFYFYTNEYVKKIDYQIYDLMMTLTNEMKEEETFYTVIVDIDEKSLQALGQWPWPRVINAKLIDKIHELNPSALGVNILFPEVDRISPVNIQEFYKRFFNLEVNFQHIPIRLKDNDKLLLDSVLNAKATLSTYFNNDTYSSKHCNEISYKKNMFEKRETQLKADFLLCNHEKLQSKVENFGFINAWRDSDGVFRRVPLFIKYKEKTFPSFALATLLSFDENVYIDSKEDTLLLNFPLKKPKVFSAIDILNGNISLDKIQGKIVILGSSFVGLTPTYKISTGEKISNSMIHAVAIDNILNNDFLRQDENYKNINLLISFFLILGILYLFVNKFYLQIVLGVSLAVILSLAWTIYSYFGGKYISIGYFLVPFLSLLIMLILYYVWAMNKEQQAQEKLFIRQSKLASMGEMISLIAHQWRQPLSVINGTVLNMDMDYRKENLDKEKLNKYLDDIEITTAFLSKTISDFTDFFSKNKEAHLFRLSSVINQAKGLSLNPLICNVEVICEQNKEIEIKGYASELVQSLLVLLNNAMYVCQENLPKVEKGKIFIRVSKVGKNVLIAVEDNGGGIAKKDMKKIFNPYYTTKEKQNGTGLGLYILKLIVEDSMNGKISVLNTQEGAIFTIQIPTNME